MYFSGDGYLACFYFLDIGNNAAMTRVYRCPIETPLSIFWCIYPEVEWLNHVTILFLIFCRIAILFSSTATLFNIPINITQDSPHPYWYLFVVVLSVVAILMGLRWYLTVVFICIP